MIWFDVLAHLIREGLFPTRCVSCASFGEWWCEDCRRQSEVLRRSMCAGCGSAAHEHGCSQSLNGLNALMAVGFYHDPRLRSVITALKYRGATCLVPEIRSHLVHWKKERLDPWPWSGESELAIQPVSTTPSRVRMRGFDQAIILAHLFGETCVPWATECDVLERHEGQAPQASLESEILRKANVSGAFFVRKGVSVPKTILLVDDVFTTGSTMQDAARALHIAGAQNIYGFALAIGA